MTATKRSIGPLGTGLRALVGVGLVYLATMDGLSWGLDWQDAALGLALLPAIALALGVAAARVSPGPVRLNGPLATCVNCAVIIALVANPYTSAGAALFYGVTLLVAAWRGQPGCEASVIPNIVLRRDDQIGCPTFSPVDRFEARIREGSAPAVAR